MDRIAPADTVESSRHDGQRSFLSIQGGRYRLAKHQSTFWIVTLSLLGLGMVGALGPLSLAALAQDSSSTESKSWTSSISSGFKKSFDKIGDTLNPKPKPGVVLPGAEDDAVSLKNKGKAGPGVYMAWARFNEENGDLQEAENQYLLALKLQRDYLPALLGYAQLEERRGRPQDAIKLYQRAVKAHPQQASVHNNAGLCYARQGLLDQALTALKRAVELEPKNPLYRNNIATVLVDMGTTREAFAHLRAVHTEAEANYNLGFLLNKKGRKEEALKHFTLALQSDPSMQSAKNWVDYLQKSSPQLRLAGQPATNGTRIIGQPAKQNDSALPPPPQDYKVIAPEESKPRRLPPTKSRVAEKEGPYLPGISYGEPPAAPMPPPTSNSALLQPLPRVR
jgi:tetratricopeptide (TPR) repeat protein